MALLFPEAHAEVDWSRGIEFLDKELQQIMPAGEIGLRFVDKLARVYLKTGKELRALVHIDVQGESQVQFGQRMYIIIASSTAIITRSPASRFSRMTKPIGGLKDLDTICSVARSIL